MLMVLSKTSKKKKKRQSKIKNKLVLQLMKIIRMRKKKNRAKWLQKRQGRVVLRGPHSKQKQYKYKKYYHRKKIHKLKAFYKPFPTNYRFDTKYKYKKQQRHFKVQTRRKYAYFLRKRLFLSRRKKAKKFTFTKNKKRRVWWSNLFANTLHKKRKLTKLKNKKSLIPFNESVWGSGARKWPFWSQFSDFFKINKNMYNHFWNASYRSKLPYNFLKAGWFYIRQRYFVPSRYVYLISSTWTPYYMAVFYLSMFWKNGLKRYNFKVCKYKCNNFFARHQNINEMRLVRSIRIRVKKQIRQNRFVSYTNPFPWKRLRDNHKYKHYRRRQRQYYLHLQKRRKKKKKIKIRFKRKNMKLRLYRSVFLQKISKFWKPVAFSRKRKKLLLLYIRKLLLKVYTKKKRFNKKISQEKHYFRKFAYKYVRAQNIRFKDSLIRNNHNFHYLKMRQSHRFGTYYVLKKIFLFQWMRYSLWQAMIIRKKNLLDRIFIPYKFRHTQRNPYRYYKISRWHNKSMHWLNPIIHNRKLFPYQLKYCITQEKRHPHRRKRLKIYKWLQYTINNQWTYGMRATKNYRLKQILFGRIILPALDGLLKKQFLYIKKNASHVKPLGLSNSRPTIFLGKFERRLDVLTYKLNFAPTIQWARSFVKAGLIYVSYWTMYKYTRNYKHVLTKYEKFPLLFNWSERISKSLNVKINNLNSRRLISFSGRRKFIMPLSITLPSYRVMLKGLVHWSNQNVKTWFFHKHFRRFMPQYFIYNKARTVGYFWRNLTLNDIDRLKKTRMKKNTFNWLA